ncbi:cytochrome P450 [Hamadaea tsunoensis]|uniref:cytochrome P450 n=1 Tax=Hamadaea tsunoensis TaxID=53368 RepID=UPI0004298FA2|nr:cytochrome P450 [Hamadaea tsunoensis]
MIRDLWRWTSDPITLLTERAATAPVFELRLWRKAVVGYRPEWNRAVLGDLAMFRAGGSLSGLTPYLNAGVVRADGADHADRRARLNPAFHNRGLRPLLDRLDEAAAQHRPDGRFEALDWAATLIRRQLNAALFGGAIPDTLLRRFLRPLHAPLPQPLRPRPRLFAAIDRAIAAVLAEPPAGTLAAALAGQPAAGEELRVALAAGYDTTAHTLAWLAWHLAGAPEWRSPESLPAVLDEVLRLYPAGWIGSRVAAADVEVCGRPVPAGTLVLYSPLLTHRDPELWTDPGAFRPDRFAEGRPAWGFLPFSAGRRTCLGVHLARAMLTAAARPLLDGKLEQRNGDPTPRAGLTLRPTGPLLLHYQAR